MQVKGELQLIEEKRGPVEFKRKNEKLERERERERRAEQKR